jgi:hypothetical protein
MANGFVRQHWHFSIVVFLVGLGVGRRSADNSPLKDDLSFAVSSHTSVNALN